MKRRIKLGQHFLINKDVLADIIKCIKVKKGERIIEIGAGKGILTAELVANGAKVVAIEIDVVLAEGLKKKFGKSSNLKIIRADALRILNSKFQPLNSKYKIVGNLPYQITSPLLRKIFALEKLPESLVLMVQKEVAERICARPGDAKRGFLSVLVQYYSKPEIIRIVSKEDFYPMPKVEGAILKIEIRNPCPPSAATSGAGRRAESDTAAAGSRLSGKIRNKSKILNSKFKIKKDELFKIVQAGFSQKRKKLHNSLSAGWRKNPAETKKLLQKAGIDSNLRAEDLKIQDWIKIENTLERDKALIK